MIIEACVLSLIIGFLRRGSLKSLGGIPLRHYYLFVVPLIGFGVVCSMARSGSAAEMAKYVRLMNVVQYGLLLVAAAVNFHIWEMRLFGVGELLNFLAVAVNGGAMPISAQALKIAGMESLLRPEVQERFVRHVIMDPATRLKVLTDVIPIPGVTVPISIPMRGNIPFTLGVEVVSPGDILISVALFVLIQRYMCSRPGTAGTGCAK